MLSLLEYSYQLAKDQGGCRFLQKKIDENNKEFNDLIFSKTIESYIELMNDPFGNYLTQKLTEKLSLNDDHDKMIQIVQSV